MKKQEVKEILNSAKNDVKEFPEDVRAAAETGTYPLIDPNKNVDSIEFHRGHYMVTLEDGAIYEICAICAEVQPMNMQAMENNFPEIAETMEENNKKPRWNNLTCETKHPAFKPSWV